MVLRIDLNKIISTCKLLTFQPVLQKQHEIAVTRREFQLHLKEMIEQETSVKEVRKQKAADQNNNKYTVGVLKLYTCQMI